MDFYKQLQKSHTTPVSIQQRICFPHYSWTIGQMKMQPDRSPQNVGCYKPTRLTTQKNEGFLLLLLLHVENIQIKLLYRAIKYFLRFLLLIK